MGIIERQSIGNIIINYVGIGIGIISSLFIYPLSPKIYGLSQFVYSSAIFLIPFASFGINTLIIKFYSKVKNSNQQSLGFLYSILLIGVFSYLLFLGVTWIFKDFFIEYIKFDEKLNVSKQSIYWLIMFLTGALFLRNTFTIFSSNLLKTNFPSFVNNILYKIFLPCVVLAYFYEVYSISTLGYAYLSFFLLTALILGLFVLKNFTQRHQFDLNFLSRPFVNEAASYLAFSWLNTIGKLLTFRIDIIMVGLITSYKDTGAYAIFLMLASIVDTGSNALTKIISPFVSSSWEEKDEKQLSQLYTKSSINLLVVGLYSFFIIWLCLPEIVQISSNTSLLEPYTMIFVFLGIAKLFDLATSINSEIIIYSRYYKYNLFFTIGLGLMTIVLNYFLIQSYHAIGAALGTLISLFLFNFSKLLFIWVKLKMQPFTRKTLKVIVFAILLYILCRFVIKTDHIILAFVLKGIIFSSIYIAGIYFLNISSEVNQLLDRLMKYIR